MKQQPASLVCRVVCCCLLLAGCQPLKPPVSLSRPAAVPVVHPPAVSRVRITTVPAGGEIRIEELDLLTTDGADLQLQPGFYTLVASKAGFRDSRFKVEISGDTPMRTIAVPLGSGYAPVTIASSPGPGTLSIDGVVVGRTPVMVELDAGQHRVQVALAGYGTVSQTMQVAPGVPETITVKLQPLPGSVPAQLPIKPKPQPATKPPPLAQAAADNRQKPTPAAAKPAQAPRMADSPWDGVVRSPVLLSVEPGKGITGEKIADLLEQADALHALLQPGDILEFRPVPRVFVGGSVQTVPGEGVAEFRSRLASLLTGSGEQPVIQTTGQKMTRARVELGDHPAIEIAFALHRARTGFPMLDLTQEQLDDKEEVVFRSRADGALTFLAYGGSALRVSGARVTHHGQLHIGTLNVADGPLSFRWEEKPIRLLVVAQNGSDLNPLGNELTLLGREKKLVRLKASNGIQNVVQQSHGPEYSGWIRDAARRDNLFGDLASLQSGEIGPHDQAGDYRRLWIIRYDDGSGLTQRQTSTEYRVTERKKRFESDLFLRRSTAAKALN